MALLEIKIPAMGESIEEVTITKFLKKVGESVKEDEVIVEVATDKVDSEINSPQKGVIKKINFKENDAVKVGETLMVLATDANDKIDNEPQTASSPPKETEKKKKTTTPEPLNATNFSVPEMEFTSTSSPSSIETIEPPKTVTTEKTVPENTSNIKLLNKYFSPLVKSIAKKENLSPNVLLDLKKISKNPKLLKEEVIDFLENKPSSNTSHTKNVIAPKLEEKLLPISRIRKLIGDNMVKSVSTIPHVTSVVEADFTDIVDWRNKNKEYYLEKYKEKLSFTPFFAMAIVEALKFFPNLNATVKGDSLYLYDKVNLGMAVALPNGDLIVPIMKNADTYDFHTMVAKINDLSVRARDSKLKPDEVQGGTYTFSNIGTFGNIIGTPIIPVPQLGIIAIGSIEKVPAVVSTPKGDTIAIRNKVYLSHSYDHRIVDGMLGAMYVKKVATILENFQFPKL